MYSQQSLRFAVNIAFSVAIHFFHGEWGLLLIVAHRPVTAVASLVAEHRL